MIKQITSIDGELAIRIFPSDKLKYGESVEIRRRPTYNRKKLPKSKDMQTDIKKELNNGKAKKLH